MALQQELVTHSSVAKANDIIVLQLNSRIVDPAVVDINSKNAVNIMKCETGITWVVLYDGMNAVCTVSLDAQTHS